MLKLTISEPWFSMIVKGEKKEEYRDTTPFYTTRLVNAGLIRTDGDKTRFQPRPIMLINGYKPNSRVAIIIANCSIGQGKKEWGAEPGKNYYVLNILKVIKSYDVPEHIGEFKQANEFFYWLNVLYSESIESCRTGQLQLVIAKGYDVLESPDGTKSFGVYDTRNYTIYVPGNMDEKDQLETIGHEFCHHIQTALDREHNEAEADHFGAAAYKEFIKWRKYNYEI